MDKANGKTKTRAAESIFFCKRIKSSVIVELSELLETTPNHLLGTGEYDTDILEILGVLKKMSPKLKKVALEQIKALSSVC